MRISIYVRILLVMLSCLLALATLASGRVRVGVVGGGVHYLPTQVPK